MKFKKRYPHASLARFIRHYWYFEIEANETPLMQSGFPYGAFELICYLENPNLMRWAGNKHQFFEPSIFYAGQLTQAYIMTFMQPCRCIGVSLYPWAGKHLYGIPANEFTNQLVHLDLLEPGQNLHEQLLACQNADAQFAVLETYMLYKLIKKENDQLVCNIIRQVVDAPTRYTLNKAVSANSLSRRRLEQRFIETSGLTMGAFTRKVRFQRAVHLLKTENTHSLTSVGLQVGYYDQAHFISDFKSFADLSPKLFRQQKTELNNFLETLVLAG